LILVQQLDLQLFGLKCLIDSLIRSPTQSEIKCTHERANNNILSFVYDTYLSVCPHDQ
jgi:hypothetical protein